MPSTKKSDPFHVSNLLRGLDVLELLARHPDGLGLSEIAAALGIPKNAAFRVTGALLGRGYLSRNEMDLSFALSPLLMTLGYRAADRAGLIELSLPHLRALRDAVGETVTLSKIVGLQGMVLEQVPSIHVFRYFIDHGSTFSLHGSAPGKAMLAALPEKECMELIGRLIPLKRFTPTTLTTKGALLAELERARRNGFALDRSEEFEGVLCAASAILDARGYPVGAVTVTWPSFRNSEGMFEERGGMARDCAGSIQQALGLPVS